MILTIHDEVLTIYFSSFPEITTYLPIVSLRDNKMITIDIFFSSIILYMIIVDTCIFFA